MNAQSASAASPEVLEVLDLFDDLWSVVVLDDDVTTFATVIEALVTLFGHTPSAAESLAWIVHRQGRAVVAVGSRDFAEEGVTGLHSYRIRAFCEQV